MAIRAALGSGPPRLLKQLLTESLLLSLLASVAGAILAGVCTTPESLANRLAPGVTIQLSAPVLAFADASQRDLSPLRQFFTWRASRADLQIVLNPAAAAHRKARGNSD